MWVGCRLYVIRMFDIRSGGPRKKNAAKDGCEIKPGVGRAGNEASKRQLQTSNYAIDHA